MLNRGRNGCGRWGAAVWLGLLCCGGGSAAHAVPTFAEWQSACSRLPSNRSLVGQPMQGSRRALAGFAEIERALAVVFAQATNGPLSRTDLWVGSPPVRASFFDVDRGWFTSPQVGFEPFVEKRVLPPGARVFLQGDLHGDIHSLLAVLGRLRERGWLDGFVVRDPALYLVFLGDYTDRGQYGIEVIYTLLRLKAANPDRVWLVRGNHEDVSLVARYGFLAEGQAKYGREFDAVRVLRTYDFLPAALYLGCGDDYVQLCHGGMEPGFAPEPLLQAEGTNRFQLLGPLRQAQFLRAHPNWLAGQPEAAADARRHLRDFTPAAPTTPSVIGFLWNDFTLFRDEPAFAYNPDRAYVYGAAAVEYLLAAQHAGPARVRSVIRGHQHSATPDPLMRRLVASRGLFRHWQEAGPDDPRNDTVPGLARRLESATRRPLPEHSVWTLNVTPDSVYGLGCNFDFATYSVLELGASFGDWRIEVDAVVVPAAAGTAAAPP